jgi:hypothetical protein
MPVVIVLILLYFAWRYKKGHSTSTGSPTKTATLGGSNLPGNNFDNGTTQGLGPSIPCDCPAAPGTVTYATSGGEDGTSPTAVALPITSSSVTAGNGWVAANADPPPLTLTPTFSSVVNAVKNSRFVKAL